MNLVDLVVMICSLANPGACGEKHMLFESSGSLRECMLQAPPYLAQWVGEHPDSRVVRWHCAWPESEEQKS